MNKSDLSVTNLAKKIVDNLIIGIADNDNKKPLFSLLKSSIF